MNPGLAARPQGALEDIVITGDLARRALRERSPREEVDALHALAAALPGGAASMLDELMAAAVRLCRAGTAGVSLLQRDADGAGIFRWVAVAGRLAAGVGGTTPRGFSPCGTCLDRGAAQLYDRPARYFTYLSAAGIVEGLVVPLLAAPGEPAAGTLWIVSHDEAVRFDSEDVRLLTSLASFASAALQLSVAGTEAERKLRDAAITRRRAEELIAILVHELRNPLEPIRAGLERLRLSAAPGQEQPLGDLDRHVGDLARVVDDLLDVTRLTRGSFELRRERMLLHTAVERGVAVAAPLCRERKHEVAVRCEPGIMLDGDPLRLQRLVSSLVVNAARFTPPGGRIHVSCSTAGGRASILVGDSGVGIPRGDLERIFEPFEQLPREPGCDSPGLGIGLTMVKRIAVLHGGTARAASDGPGRGSTFVVELPYQRLGLVPS